MLALPLHPPHSLPAAATSHTETPVSSRPWWRESPQALCPSGGGGPWAAMLAGEGMRSGLSDLPGSEGLWWELPSGSSAPDEANPGHPPRSREGSKLESYNNLSPIWSFKNQKTSQKKIWVVLSHVNFLEKSELLTTPHPHPIWKQTAGVRESETSLPKAVRFSSLPTGPSQRLSLLRWAAWPLQTRELVPLAWVFQWAGAEEWGGNLTA